MSRNITITGVPCFQRKEMLVTGSISAKDLIQVYEVDEWVLGKPVEEQGCQRPPIKSHYTSIGRKLKEDTTAKLPTSITLSANNKQDAPDKNTVKISHRIDINQVEVTIPAGHKLKIVDGQHRVLGAEYSIQDLKAKELEDFQFPFVLMINDDRLDEIRTFYEINTTGKKVSTDLALQLLNDWNNLKESARLTKKEQWKLVALNIAMELNKDKESVWHNTINFSLKNKDGLINATAFVNSLSPFLNSIAFVRKIWMDSTSEEQAGKKLAKLVNNYWTAISLVLPGCFPRDLKEKNNWYIQKNVGARVWNMVAPFILEECLIKREKQGDLSPENIAKFLKEYTGYGVKDAEVVWRSKRTGKGINGGEASRASSTKAYREIANTIMSDIEQNYLEKRDSVNF